MAALTDLLLKKYGSPKGGVPLPREVIDQFSRKVPEDLLSFWREHGTGLWLNGKFQFCSPLDYAKIKDILCDGDDHLAPESTHVIGFSPFGELLVWNERQDRAMIDLPKLQAFIPALDARKPGDAEHFPFQTPLMRLDRPSSADFIEDTDDADYLFARCVKKLGPVTLGQCYGFVPALGLGGRALLDHVEKLDAKVHFHILASIGRCRLMVFDSEGTPQFSRLLGPQGG